MVCDRPQMDRMNNRRNTHRYQERMGVEFSLGFLRFGNADKTRFPKDCYSPTVSELLRFKPLTAAIQSGKRPPDP